VLLKVYGLRFRVFSLGFSHVCGLGFRLYGLGFRVQGLFFGVEWLWIRV